MDVLIEERPWPTTALQKLGTFSDTATKLANESQDDLVRNLRTELALAALADVGPELPSVLEFAAHYPFTQNFIDRDIRGDYFNLFATIDLDHSGGSSAACMLELPLGAGERPAGLAPGDPAAELARRLQHSVSICHCQTRFPAEAPVDTAGVTEALPRHHHRMRGRSCPSRRRSRRPCPVHLRRLLRPHRDRRSPIFAGPMRLKPPFANPPAPTTGGDNAHTVCPDSADSVHHRIDRGRGSRAVRPHAGSDALGIGRITVKAGAAQHRWALRSAT